MFKRMTLMASVAVAAVAFALPTVASAEWTDGTAEVKTNPNISFAGSLAFTGELGGTNCQQVTAAAQITGGQIFAHTNSFAVDNPKGCTTSGPLAFCQLQLVTFEPTQPLPWTIYTTTNDIEITTPTFQYHYQGGFCPTPTIQLEAASLTVTVAAGEQHAVKQVTLSGTVTGTAGGGAKAVTLHGTWNMTPSGTYGIT